MSLTFIITFFKQIPSSSPTVRCTGIFSHLQVVGILKQCHDSIAGNIRGLLTFGIISEGLFHNRVPASPKIPTQVFKFYNVIIYHYIE